MKFIFTDGSNPDFIRLCHMLDDCLNEIAGGEKNRAQYIPYNTLEDIHDVVLAYEDNAAIGCAGFKLYQPGIAEVKRVFIEKAQRGRGISKQLMCELEGRAREKGFCKLILETGEPLVEAMNLYRSIGYKVMDHYGQYKEMPESVCMLKVL